MSAVQSTTLPWMLYFIKWTKILLKKLNSFDLLILLLAFLYGNLFAIANCSINWSLVLIFCIVFFLELINKIIYLRGNNNFLQILEFYPLILLNLLKRGFILGLFLEAFKVGS